MKRSEPGQSAGPRSSARRPRLVRRSSRRAGLTPRSAPRVRRHVRNVAQVRSQAAKPAQASRHCRSRELSAHAGRLPYAPCSSRRPSRSAVYARYVQTRARGAGQDDPAGRSLTVTAPRWPARQRQCKCTCIASRARLHSMGPLVHNARAPAPRRRNRWRRRSFVAIRDCLTDCLVSLPRARVCTLRANTAHETRQVRQSPSVRHPPRDVHPRPSPLTRAREPTGSTGQTKVREPTGVSRSKLDITCLIGMPFTRSIKMRHTAC